MAVAIQPRLVVRLRLPLLLLLRRPLLLLRRLLLLLRRLLLLLRRLLLLPLLRLRLLKRSPRSRTIWVMVLLGPSRLVTVRRSRSVL